MEDDRYLQQTYIGHVFGRDSHGHVTEAHHTKRVLLACCFQVTDRYLTCCYIGSTASARHCQYTLNNISKYMKRQKT